MTQQTDPDEPLEPTTDPWGVSDSANELGVDAFDTGSHGPGFTR